MYVFGNPVNLTDPSGSRPACEDGSTNCDEFRSWVLAKIKPKKPEGVRTDNEIGWSGLMELMFIASENGFRLLPEDLLAYVIATEYIGSYGADADWNTAMARKYRDNCNDGVYSASCVNGFWSYMQGIRTPSWIDINRWILHRTKHDEYLWGIAKDIAHAIMNPDEPNDYGITPSMNTCYNQRCHWDRINSGAPNYQLVKDTYFKFHPWWIFREPGGDPDNPAFDLLLLADQDDFFLQK